MPAGINTNGTITRRPGAYANVDASALSGATVEINRVAVVMSIPTLEKAKPVRVNNAKQLAALNPNDYDLSLVARLLWNPAVDDRVSGGPPAVFAVSPTTTTAGTLTLNDDDTNPSIDLTNKIYGPEGNKVTTTVTINAVDSSTRDLTFGKDGVTETFTGIGGGKLASFWYTGTDATETKMYADWQAAAPLLLTWEKDTMAPAVSPGTDFAVNLHVANAKITLTPGDPATAPGAGEWVDVTITGFNSLGEAAQETVDGGSGQTWDALENASVQSTTLWSRITNINVMESSGGSATTDVIANAWGFNFTAAGGFNNLSDAVAHVNTFSADGWNAAIESPKAYSTPIDQLDDASATGDVLGASQVAGAVAYAGVYWIIETLNASSAFVEAARNATDGGEVPHTLAATAFSGGTSTAADQAAWEAALAALEIQDVQIVWANTTDAAVHDAVRLHCIKMAGTRGNERNAWVGTTSQATKASVKTATAGLNTRHVAMCAQDIKVRDQTGAAVWVAPTFQALQCAGIQAGTNVGTPMTWKRPNVLDVRQNADWNPDAGDADEMLEHGLCFFSRDRLGFKVERSITTYQTDDNPIFSEVSANESLDTTIRYVREQVEIAIGDPNLTATRGRVENITKNAFREAVRLAYCKAVNLKALEVEDLGDRFRINAEVAPIEPTNFIEINITATRTPFGQ